MRYLRDHQVQLPRLRNNQIVWVRPSYQIIYNILKLPAYAGAYAFGKLERIHLPGKTGQVTTRKRDIEDWPVLLHDAYPAYISWDQFLANQKQLHLNAQGASWTCGAPRKGAALLQGIVICGRCGRTMHIHYTHSPAYICDFETRAYGGPRCQNFTLAHIDPVISQVLLEAIQPARLEAALAAFDQLEADRQTLILHWQQRLERAQYEVDLAQCRYEQVDPRNRLVAAELEHLWEKKLLAQSRLLADWQDFQASQLQPLSVADQETIRSLADNLPALWQVETTSQEDRKRLLRCLIRDVTLDSVSNPGHSLIHIRWHTGAVTTRSVPRPGHGPPPAKHIIDRIRSMALIHPDERIARILNQENFPTATGLPWSRDRVYAVRRKHNIPTACSNFNPSPNPRGDGLTKSKFAAMRFGVHSAMVSHWFRKGLIDGYQANPRSPIWVSLSDEVIHRLDGCHPLSDEMIPLPQVLDSLNLSEADLCVRIRAGDFTPYRIFHDNYWHWYLLPAADNPQSFPL